MKHSIDTGTQLVEERTFVMVPASEFKNIANSLDRIETVVNELSNSDEKEWIPLKDFCDQIQISYSQYQKKKDTEFADWQMTKRANKLYVHRDEKERYWQSNS